MGLLCKICMHADQNGIDIPKQYKLQKRLSGNFA